jgi:hypothetical protein
MKKFKKLVKEEKKEGHKAKSLKEFVAEEKKESYHKGPKKNIIKEEFGSEKRAECVAKMLKK